MGITRYSDIASMQNPGSQRTGKAGGGRVKKTEGSQAERRAPRIRRGVDIIIEEATAEGVGERIGANLPIPGGAWAGRMAEKAGRGFVKRRKAKKAKKKATVTDEDSKKGKKKKKTGK